MTTPDDQTANAPKRDEGTDTPGDGSADRPAGTVDPDANPPISDPDEDTPDFPSV